MIPAPVYAPKALLGPFSDLGLIRLNRKTRRFMRAQIGRTDGLDKTGFAWCSFETRVARYRKARRVKLARERTARKETMCL